MNSGLSPIRILLVEDDEHDRLAFRRTFKKSHMVVEITECDRAEDALQRLSVEPSAFDLVVVDHQLPGMSGLHLCKKLIAENLSSPLVILTGKGSQHLAVEALKAGVDDYIVKEPDRGYLGLLPLVIQQVLRRHDERQRRKQAEEALRNMNDELKEFIHVVTHDLNSPIYTIGGFCSIMLKHHEKELNKECRGYLEHIKINAHRIEVLASDLTTLLKIGRVAFTPRDVSSLQVVKNTATALREKLDTGGIELVMAEDLPNIYCDEEKIYQVFDNLLSNAIKFVQETENPKIEISWKDNGAFYQFSVSDNGIGIDPKYHREIFGKFKRLQEVKDEQGTGLGLAIVDRIVKNHGGTVSVQSAKGKGATFHFTLPKASQSPGKP